MIQNITIEQVVATLVFILLAINTTASLLEKFKNPIEKKLAKTLEPLQEELTNIRNELKSETLSRCKYDLISIMTKIENGYKPLIEEKRLLYEIKELYNANGGDSYVDDMFDNLKKEGKL